MCTHNLINNEFLDDLWLPKRLDQLIVSPVNPIHRRVLDCTFPLQLVGHPEYIVRVRLCTRSWKREAAAGGIVEDGIFPHGEDACAQFLVCAHVHTVESCFNASLSHLVVRRRARHCWEKECKQKGEWEGGREGNSGRECDLFLKLAPSSGRRHRKLF